MVRVKPFADGAQRKRLGTLKGTMRIRHDLVSSNTTADWESMRPAGKS